MATNNLKEISKGANSKCYHRGYYFSILKVKDPTQDPIIAINGEPFKYEDVSSDVKYSFLTTGVRAKTTDRTILTYYNFDDLRPGDILFLDDGQKRRISNFSTRVISNSPYSHIKEYTIYLQ